MILIKKKEKYLRFLDLMNDQDEMSFQFFIFFAFTKLVIKAII